MSYRKTQNRQNAYLLRFYGITRDDYLRLLREQGGKCALCGRLEQEKLHIDHSHITGKVRGLLCRSCNVALGALGDDEAGLKRAIAYLERTK